MTACHHVIHSLLVSGSIPLVAFPPVLDTRSSMNQNTSFFPSHGFFQGGTTRCHSKSSYDGVIHHTTVEPSKLTAF